MSSRNTTTIRDFRNFIGPCNFINKAISHTAEVEIHTRPKLYHFGRYLVKVKLFCWKCFVPVTWLECSYGKIFIPVTEISVAKTEISVAGPASPLYEHIDISTKKRVARRDLGNRASLRVDRAHMKRPKNSPPKSEFQIRWIKCGVLINPWLLLICFQIAWSWWLIITGFMCSAWGVYI